MDNLLLPVVPALLKVQILKIVRSVVTSVQPYIYDSFSLKACDDQQVRRQKFSTKCSLPRLRDEGPLRQLLHRLRPLPLGDEDESVRDANKTLAEKNGSNLKSCEANRFWQ